MDLYAEHLTYRESCSQMSNMRAMERNVPICRTLIYRGEKPYMSNVKVLSYIQPHECWPSFLKPTATDSLRKWHWTHCTDCWLKILCKSLPVLNELSNLILIFRIHPGDEQLLCSSAPRSLPRLLMPYLLPALHHSVPGTRSRGKSPGVLSSMPLAH